MQSPYAGTEQEREYEYNIRRTIEGVLQAALHPRTVVSVILQVMSEDGSLLACALNAACTALVDAAIPLSSTFCM
jgi:exosome complex component RRP46